jgi:hypothetical protein
VGVVHVWCLAGFWQIQLVPIEYFRMRIDVGHKKYIMYRNMKAE